MQSKIAASKVVGYVDLFKSTELVLYADIWFFFFLLSISFVCHAWRERGSIYQIFKYNFDNFNIISIFPIKISIEIHLWRSKNTDDLLTTHWRAAGIAWRWLAKRWQPLDDAVFTGDRWRGLAIFLNIPKKSPSLTKRWRRLTSAGVVVAMYWRCLATSGDALAMCPKLLVASASPDVASWCERGFSGKQKICT